MHPEHLATAAAATVGILVGAAMVATKAVGPDVSPATLAFLRYAIAFAVLLLPAYAFRRTRFAPGDAGVIGLLGIMQFAVLILLLNYALATVSATICAMVFSTMPLVTVSLAIGMGREPYSARKALGVAFAVLGAVYLLGTNATPSGGASSALGLAALIAATLIGAVTSILYGPYLRRYPALPTCVLAMGAAVVFLFLLCWANAEPLLPTLNAIVWSLVIFIGLSSAVGYFCWLWALAKLGAGNAVAFQALGPVTAALLDIAIERRLPSYSLLIALVAVTLGLRLSITPGTRDADARK